MKHRHRTSFALIGMLIAALVIAAVALSGCAVPIVIEAVKRGSESIEFDVKCLTKGC